MNAWKFHSKSKEGCYATVYYLNTIMKCPPPFSLGSVHQGRKAQCFLKSARCHLNDLNHMNPQHSTSQRNRMTARVSGASGMKRRWNGLFNRQRARNCRGGGSLLHQELFCAWKTGKGEWKLVCGGVGVRAGWPHTTATSHLGFILTRAQKLPSVIYSCVNE